MLLREILAGQDIIFDFDEQFSNIQLAGSHGFIHGAQLLSGCFLVGLGEDRAQGRCLYRLVITRHVRKQVKHKMHPASLTSRSGKLMVNNTRVIYGI